MRELNEIIKELILRREQGKSPITLLAVCPNSSAVLEAAVKVAAQHHTVMLFAATLNQVDFENSYTGWTPAEFVHEMHGYADKYAWNGPLYPCLDHGGPWLKDLHTLANLDYMNTMKKVKASITACVQAGYRLLHIDPTVDRTRPPGEPLPLELVVDRTVELIEYAEGVRIANNFDRLAYEVGTEEVHGGLVDIGRFSDFINLLQAELGRKNLSSCWPCLLVAQIGTDLHTTTFQPNAARRIFNILAPLGSLAKGHYTDWVENPAQYPLTGMGAANVGPEFTAEEYAALSDLEDKEMRLIHQPRASHFVDTLQEVVIGSGRWKKWLLPEEQGIEFNQLTLERREWLLKTGSRYIWTNPQVVARRHILYHNLAQAGVDAQLYVIDRIASVIEKYIHAFNLKNSVDSLGF